MHQSQTDIFHQCQQNRVQTPTSIDYFRLCALIEKEKTNSRHTIFKRFKDTNVEEVKKEEFKIKTFRNSLHNYSQNQVRPLIVNNIKVRRGHIQTKYYNIFDEMEAQYNQKHKHTNIKEKKIVFFHRKRKEKEQPLLSQKQTTQPIKTNNQIKEKEHNPIKIIRKYMEIKRQQGISQNTSSIHSEFQ